MQRAADEVEMFFAGNTSASEGSSKDEDGDSRGTPMPSGLISSTDSNDAGQDEKEEL